MQADPAESTQGQDQGGLLWRPQHNTLVEGVPGREYTRDLLLPQALACQHAQSHPMCHRIQNIKKW